MELLAKRNEDSFTITYGIADDEMFAIEDFINVLLGWERRRLSHGLPYITGIITEGYTYLDDGNSAIIKPVILFKGDFSHIGHEELRREFKKSLLYTFIDFTADKLKQSNISMTWNNELYIFKGGKK